MEPLKPGRLKNAIIATGCILSGTIPLGIFAIIYKTAEACDQMGINICDIVKPGSRPVEGACLDNDFVVVEDLQKECALFIQKVTLCDDKSCGVAGAWECEE